MWPDIINHKIIIRECITLVNSNGIVVCRFEDVIYIKYFIFIEHK